MSFSQNNEAISRAVDDIFRQTSPPTPPKVVQNVLSSGETSIENSAETDSLTDREQSKDSEDIDFAETSASLPPPAVTPVFIEPIQVSQSTTTAKNNESTTKTKSNQMCDNMCTFWIVLGTLVGLAIFALVWHNFDAIKGWFSSSPTRRSTLPSTSEIEIQLREPEPELNSETTVNPDVTENDDIVQTLAPSQEQKTKEVRRVRFSEEKNQTKLIPSNKDMQKVMQADEATGKELLEKLELSLNTMARTSAEMESARSAAIEATDQKEKGSRLRLGENDQYSRKERIETISMKDENRESAQSIYDKYGGNSVVGNAQQAPYVTFAPGEEPVRGMVPDYDERTHGNGTNELPPLESGKPHSMLELINDHCLRTGKPLPKAGDISNFDVHKISDTSTHVPMRVADSDGHYLQSKKKQSALMRANTEAVKNIYAKKHATASGQLLDRGPAALSAFAGSQNEDAIQFLNVHSL